MADSTTHQAIADDGTVIVGRVVGQGPPLVVVPASLAGDLEWGPLLPYLSERFTCYVMDRSSRARNTDSWGFSHWRAVADVVAFIDSVGEPVGLLGASWSGMLSLGAVRRTSAVRALGVWEPSVGEVNSEEARAHMAQTMDEARRLVDDGHLHEAVRSWHLESGVASEEEFAAMPDEVYEAVAAVFPAQLDEYRQAVAAVEAGESTPTDPSELAAISVPVLLLHGSESMRWFVDGVRHVAEHVPDATVRAIDGVGHGGFFHAPAAVAQQFAEFLDDALEPAREELG